MTQLPRLRPALYLLACSLPSTCCACALPSHLLRVRPALTHAVPLLLHLRILPSHLLRLRPDLSPAMPLLLRLRPAFAPAMPAPCSFT